jgi:aspartate 4-decarboxylase
MEIVHRRAKAMIEGLGIEAPTSDLYDAYYGLIDFEFWARKNLGDEAVQYLKRTSTHWTWRFAWPSSTASCC